MNFKSKNVSTLILIVSNLSPLIGVAFFGWRVYQIMLLYWVESVIIGFFSILKMGLSQQVSTKRRALKKFQMGIFFIMHYGFFMYLYVCFIVGVFGGHFKNIFDTTIILNELRNVVWAALSIFLSHAHSFVNNFCLNGAYLVSKPTPRLFAAYKRVITLHIGIMSAAVALAYFGTSWQMLVGFVGIKIILDALVSQRENNIETGELDQDLIKQIKNEALEKKPVQSVIKDFFREMVAARRTIFFVGVMALGFFGFILPKMNLRNESSNLTETHSLLPHAFGNIEIFFGNNGEEDGKKMVVSDQRRIVYTGDRLTNLAATGRVFSNATKDSPCTVPEPIPPIGGVPLLEPASSKVLSCIYEEKTSDGYLHEFSYLQTEGLEINQEAQVEGWEKQRRELSSQKNSLEILGDEEVKKTARDFLVLHNVSFVGYDETVVEKISPTEIEVIFPFTYKGHVLFDSKGKRGGIRVKMADGGRSVKTVIGIKNHQYVDSEYELETSAERIIAQAIQGGINGVMLDKENDSPVMIELGTPSQVYLDFFQNGYTQFSSREFLIPALAFPIRNTAQSVRTQQVIVPLVKEALDNLQGLD